jgi:hypothetical protein
MESNALIDERTYRKLSPFGEPYAATLGMMMAARCPITLLSVWMFALEDRLLYAIPSCQ